MSWYNFWKNPIAELNLSFGKVGILDIEIKFDKKVDLNKLNYQDANKLREKILNLLTEAKLLEIPKQTLFNKNEIKWFETDKNRIIDNLKNGGYKSTD